jgi:hypothetical protein
MRKRLFRITLGVLLIVGFTLPVHAGRAARFRVRLDLVQTGPPTPSPRCPASTVLVSLTGSGTGTRLGPVSADASHCIVDDPSVPSFDEGTMRLSSRHGDIFIEYSGTDTDGVIEGTFTIVGGTGAYEGATGGGTLSGFASREEERGFGLLDGRIE